MAAGEVCRRLVDSGYHPSIFDWLESRQPPASGLHSSTRNTIQWVLHQPVRALIAPSTPKLKRDALPHANDNCLPASPNSRSAYATLPSQMGTTSFSYMPSPSIWSESSHRRMNLTQQGHIRGGIRVLFSELVSSAAVDAVEKRRDKHHSRGWSVRTTRPLHQRGLSCYLEALQTMA